MPPRLNFYGASRSLTIRSRSSILSFNPRLSNAMSRRGYADETNKLGGPNESGLGHVSEEAADIGRVKGETEPDLGQGTPVQEILERDEESKKKAPEIIKEEIDSPKKNSLASASIPEDLNAEDRLSFANLLALGQMQNIAQGGTADDPVDVSKVAGLKFDPIEKPYPKDYKKDKRYDPIVDQVINLMMKDGKKSVAQRNMSFILNQLRTAPPPTPNPARPLLPGAPPPHHLPLNPIGYLALAIDSVAPLVRIRNQRGAAGGGAALPIPIPLKLRQRRRQAVQWILDAANKKRSRGSGRGLFAQRVADEIIAVVEGKSSAWEKRLLIHKTGTTARSNVGGKSKRKNF